MKTLYDNDTFGLGKIITFPQMLKMGIRGCVFLLETLSGNKYVFKIYHQKKDQFKIDFEFEALKQRKKIGIKTPKIYKIGIIQIEYDHLLYSIMQFIEKSYTINRYTPGIVAEIGKIMGKMHNIKGIGFGPIKKLQGGKFIGLYKTQADLLYGDEYRLYDFKKILRKESNKDEYNIVLRLIDRAIQKIINSSKISKVSTLLHTDLNPHNMIFTLPVTIIDPNVFLGHPYEDIALFILNILFEDNLTNTEKKRLIAIIIKSYEKTTKLIIDKEILDACIILRSIWRFVIRRDVFGEKKIYKTIKIIYDIQEKNKI